MRWRATTPPRAAELADPGHRVAVAATVPASLSDKDALLVGTGRRAPTDAEKAELGELAAKLPLVLG